MLPTVHSDCSSASTEKAIKIASEALAEGLKILNDVIRNDEKLPHGFDMSFDWILLTSRENKQDVIASMSFGITSSLLQMKKDDEPKVIPGYTYAFQFKVDPADVNYDGIHDGVLHVLTRAYEVTSNGYK